MSEKFSLTGSLLSSEMENFAMISAEKIIALCAGVTAFSYSSTVYAGETRSFTVVTNAVKFGRSVDYKISVEGDKGSGVWIRDGYRLTLKLQNSERFVGMKTVGQPVVKIVDNSDPRDMSEKQRGFRFPNKASVGTVSFDEKKNELTVTIKFSSSNEPYGAGANQVLKKFTIEQNVEVDRLRGRITF
jgi:hypothetical protein